MNLRLRPIVLVGLGLVWLAADLYLMVGYVILRETSLGFIARSIDKMPAVIATPLFILLWAVTLLGWIVPLAFGFRWLLNPKGSH